MDESNYVTLFAHFKLTIWNSTMATEKDYSEDSNNFFLNEQNKKKKKELKEKYGITDSGFESEAPPEIINSFLNYVEQFEENWEKRESKKIREVLNNPAFTKAEEIEPELLKEEIEKVLKVYAEHNFFVDIIEKDEVKDIDFYKFLTEELLEHETDLINVPGMNTNFIYEEFHPNPKLNIKDCVEYFHWGLKEKDKEQILLWSAKESIVLNNVNCNRDEFANKLFILFPDNIEETKINFKEINVNDLKAQIELIISFKSGDKDRSEIYNIIFGFNRVDADYMEIKSLEIITI